MRKLQTQDSRLQTQDSRLKTEDSKLKIQDCSVSSSSVLGLVSWVLCLVFCLLCPIVEADSSIRGAFSFSGFATGVGTRAMGMNGAFVAVSDDSSSAYWNPAGLTSSLYKELSFTRADLHDLDLITNNTFNISAPEAGGGALSFSWNQLRYDFQSWREEVYLISYAKTLVPVAHKPSRVVRGFSLSCGATFKYLRQTSKLDITPETLSVPDMEQAASPALHCKSKGVGLDLGLLARFSARDGRNKFSIGIAAQDVPTVVRWNSGDLETEEYIPYRYKAGCSFEPLPRVTVALDLVGEQNVELKEIHFGLEHWIFPHGTQDKVTNSPPRPISEKNLAIRGGIARQLSASERMTFAGGLSVRWAAWQLDYAYLMDSKGLGDTRNRFSVSVRF